MKIYTGKGYTPLLGHVLAHDHPFHFEREKYVFTETIEEADIIPLILPPFDEKTTTVQQQLEFIGSGYKDKWLIIMMHTHASDSATNTFLLSCLEKYDTKKTLLVSLAQIDHPNYIYNNFCFNLVKAQYFDYNDHYWGNPPYDMRLFVEWCGKESYELRDIKTLKSGKKFLVPNITRLPGETEFLGSRNIFRIKLQKYLNHTDCYYSDTNNGIYLLPQENKLFPELDLKRPGCIPIHNGYYEDTIISVFVETITTSWSNLRVISEKTYIPLVKGHFILPFSYPGIVKDLKEQGFKFPDWIDYSYDNIVDDEERFNKFIDIFMSLRQTPLDVLLNYANNDQDLRFHNRSIFKNSKYHSLYDQIKEKTSL